MSFDITFVNTGLSAEACALLEQNMDKKMLSLAILEIMLEEVVVKSLGVSSGPDILLFKRFKIPWMSINNVMFQTSITHNLINEKNNR